MTNKRAARGHRHKGHGKQGAEVVRVHYYLREMSHAACGVRPHNISWSESPVIVTCARCAKVLKRRERGL